MKCANCGNEVSHIEKICSNCGENNVSYIPPAPPPVYQQPPQQYGNNPYGNTDPYAQQGGQTYQQTNIYVQPQVQNKESKVYAILALVFGALGGWLGLLFGIIGLTRYKGDIHSSERVMCGIGIGLWVFWLVVNIILLATL